MKISKLRTLWIILLSSLYTLNTTGRSVLMRYLGKTNRPWVDKQLQSWANHLIRLVKVNCKVINPYGIEPLPGKATIVMCNHSSLYDIPLSFKAFPNHSIRMLSKKELSRIPIVGKGMTAAEFPFIDRKNRNQALRDLEEVRKLLESGIVMWIAPEGTRSKDGKLAAFKKGAFITAIQAQASIIPIAIQGAFDILPARTLQVNINQQAKIRVGKPFDASLYTLETKEELANAVYQEMQELLKHEE